MSYSPEVLLQKSQLIMPKPVATIRCKAVTTTSDKGADAGPAMPACGGVYNIVRLSEITPGGTGYRRGSASITAEVGVLCAPLRLFISRSGFLIHPIPSSPFVLVRSRRTQRSNAVVLSGRRTAEEGQLRPPLGYLFGTRYSLFTAIISRSEKRRALSFQRKVLTASSCFGRAGAEMPLNLCVFTLGTLGRGRVENAGAKCHFHAFSRAESPK